MKKFIKVASVAMATLMMVSMIPFTSASAAAKKKEIKSSNVNAGIKLTWDKTQNAGKYTVYRSNKKSGKGTVIGSTKKTAFTDKNAKAGQIYYYTVKTSNGTSYAKEKAARLNAPKLNKVKINKYDEIKMSWSAVKGAERYRIYRAKVKANGTVGEFKFRWSTKRTSDWDWVNNAGTYIYRITASVGDCESAASNEVRIMYVPSTNIYPALSTDYSSIEVTFYPVKGVDGYRIYRASSVDATEKLIADIPASEANVSVTDDLFGYTYFEDYTYVDSDIEFGQGYVYSIETYIGDNTSERRAQSSEAIYLQRADVELKVGETYDELSTALKEYETYYEELLEYSGYEDLDLNITATSENPEIATIGDDYVITGVAPGEAVIVITISGKMGDKKFEDRVTMNLTEKISVYVGE